MKCSALSSVLALASVVAAMPSVLDLGHLARVQHATRTGKLSTSKLSRRQTQNMFLLGPSPKIHNKKSRTVQWPPASSNTPTYNPLAGSYYADWTGDVTTPESVDWTKFDLVYFAFAIPDKDGKLYWTQDDSENLLSRVVALSHSVGGKVVVSCGGWTGSTWFSQIVRTSDGRARLVKSMKEMVDRFSLDGIDIDWEYPGMQGDNNVVSGDDSANLTVFLKLLRQALGNSKTISMAVSQQPFAGPDGNPLPSVASQAQYIDHILIMNYDVYASSSTPGPNAPLSNGCGDSQYPYANAVAAIAAWEAAGMKPSQLHLGLPAYGYVSDSTATSLVDRKRKRSMPKDYFWDGMKAGRERRQRARQLAAATPTSTRLTPTVKACPFNHGGFGCDTDPSASHPPVPSASTIIKASSSGDLSAFMGQQIGFSSIVQLGALIRDPSVQSSLSTFTSTWEGHAGYTRYWDSCASVPFLVNEIRSTVVTYDDDVSIQLKAAYAASQRIGGIGFWSLDGDWSASGGDNNYALMCAARAGLGKSC